MNEKQQRHKNLKKKKRRRLLRYITLLAAAAALVAAFVYVAVQAVSSGVFNIKHIEVTGNEVVDSETVVEASGIAENSSIFWVDINKAHYNIRELVNVESLEISKVLPDKIVIRIKEVPSICAINYDGAINYIDEKGCLVEHSDYLRKTDIPLITGFTDVSFGKIGETVSVNPDWKYDTVMELLKIFKNDGNLSKISEIGITENNDYKIITKNNVIIHLKDLDNFKNNYSYILTVLQQNKSNLDINLTVGNNPVVKAR
ncbi:MAG: FtsQ-type POTRA domain-containing protein [Eubacterium sp.]|nr:FtsQ-type POTRA domain-containing protein [Eubacterium sp.]